MGDTPKKNPGAEAGATASSRGLGGRRRIPENPKMN
jgi:hypothetical protein